MEECVFRAIPLSLGALIGARYGRRTLGIAIAVVLQALVFGGAHANYPGFPAYSRPVELLLPSIIWALIFLRFGLLPTILLHATFDLTLFSIPVFLVDAPGARVQQVLVIAAALVPLAIVAWRALAGRRLARAARRRCATAHGARAAAPTMRRIRRRRSIDRGPLVGGVPARAAGARRCRLRRVGAASRRFTPTCAPLRLDRADAIAAADAALAARGVDARPAVAAVRDREARDRRRAAMAVAQVRLARGGRRGVSTRSSATMLAPPVWEVRYATFGGDVVARAEEWRVTRRRRPQRAHDRARAARGASRRAPRARSGARARRSVRSRTRFDVDAAPLKLVAADEQQRPARTDWSFIFGDPRIVVGGRRRGALCSSPSPATRCPARVASCTFPKRGCAPNASATIGCRSWRSPAASSSSRRDSPRSSSASWLDPASCRCARAAHRRRRDASRSAVLSAANGGRRWRCGFRRPSRSHRS